MLPARWFQRLGLATGLTLTAACGSSPSSPVAQAGGAGNGGASGASGGDSQAGGGATGGSAGAGGGKTGGSGGSGGAGTGGGASFEPLTGRPLVYVSGTGSSGNLWAFDLDRAAGALSKRSEHTAGVNPSYLALDPSRTHLYACNADDSAQGGVTALAIGADGALTLLNHVTGSDGGFAHLAVDPSGALVLAASFGGNSVSVFPVEADAKVGGEVALFDFGDQAAAHAIAFDQGGQHVLVPTLGRDAIQQLLLAKDGTLSANTPPFAAAAAGAGPRHIAVHPAGKLAFVINERDSTVASYQVSAEGTLTAAGTISSVPEGTTVENTGSHIELSPDGRFVYASNRGHDSIAVFAVDPLSGALTLVEHEPTRGAVPRDFDVDPNGSFLVVATQESNTVAAFAIAADGKLSPLGEPVAAPNSPRAVQIHYLAD